VECLLKRMRTDFVHAVRERAAKERKQDENYLTYATWTFWYARMGFRTLGRNSTAWKVSVEASKEA